MGEISFSLTILERNTVLGKISGLADCNLLCYKDPVLKNHPWTAYIDRSPGAAGYSVECFHACVSGCGYKFNVEKETVDQVTPAGRPKPPPVQKPKPPPVEPLDLPEDFRGIIHREQFVACE
ncbi:unnamed protein product [Sphenostylis stenocarpa]|uniref:Uncharacterized protein n=1 Tax=Sphenostylis stenocarpa TaxID=92480 RepID=A0AA86VNN1_9FABA|nr:unnamed protein product [Sphenostylis stenocarpa]